MNTACNLSGQSLDEVMPSPETVQALRRSLLRGRGLEEPRVSHPGETHAREGFRRCL